MTNSAPPSQRVEISLATRVPTQDRFINLSVRRCPEIQGQIQADTLEYPNETQWNWRRDGGPRIANALDIQTKDVLGGWGADRPEPREAIEHTMRGFAVMRRASARSEFDTAVSEFRQALTTAPSLLVFEW